MSAIILNSRTKPDQKYFEYGYGVGKDADCVQALLPSYKSSWVFGQSYIHKIEWEEDVSVVSNVQILWAAKIYGEIKQNIRRRRAHHAGDSQQMIFKE